VLFILSKVRSPDTLLITCDTPIAGSCIPDKGIAPIARDTAYQNFITDLMTVNGIKARGSDIIGEAFKSLGVLPSWALLKYMDKPVQRTSLRVMRYGGVRIIVPCLCYGKGYAMVALRFLSGD
jgi:hypothetical protein